MRELLNARKGCRVGKGCRAGEANDGVPWQWAGALMPSLFPAARGVRQSPPAVRKGVCGIDMIPHSTPLLFWSSLSQRCADRWSASAKGQNRMRESQRNRRDARVAHFSGAVLEGSGQGDGKLCSRPLCPCAIPGAKLQGALGQLAKVFCGHRGAGMCMCVRA